MSLVTNDVVESVMNDLLGEQVAIIGQFSKPLRSDYMTLLRDHVRTALVAALDDTAGKGSRMVRVADLKPGDRTSWYEVVGEPFRDRQPGLLRVPVRYNHRVYVYADGATTSDFIYGAPDKDVLLVESGGETP